MYSKVINKNNYNKSTNFQTSVRKFKTVFKIITYKNHNIHHKKSQKELKLKIKLLQSNQVQLAIKVTIFNNEISLLDYPHKKEASKSKF